MPTPLYLVDLPSVACPACTASALPQFDRRSPLSDLGGDSWSYTGAASFQGKLLSGITIALVGGNFVLTISCGSPDVVIWQGSKAAPGATGTYTRTSGCDATSTIRVTSTEPYGLAPTSICDLTSTMRYLSELRHHALGLSSDYFWPDQRAAPFEKAPTNGEYLAEGFYGNDYAADPDYFYDDLSSVVSRYNEMKDYCVKTVTLEGSSTLVPYTTADDFNPGLIDKYSWQWIYIAVINRCNLLNRLYIAPTITNRRIKYLFSADTGSCANAKTCLNNNWNAINWNTTYQFTTGCIVSTSGAATPVNYPIGLAVSTSYSAPNYNANGMGLQGYVYATVNNQTLPTPDIYLKLTTPDSLIGAGATFGQPRQTTAPVNTYGRFSGTVVVYNGVINVLVDITSLDVAAQVCGGEKSGWELADAVVVISRAPKFVAYATCGGSAPQPPPPPPPVPPFPIFNRSLAPIRVVSDVNSRGITFDGACYRDPQPLVELTEEDAGAVYGGRAIGGCEDPICGPRSVYQYSNPSDPDDVIQVLQPDGHPLARIALRSNPTKCYTNPVFINHFAGG